MDESRDVDVARRSSSESTPRLDGSTTVRAAVPPLGSLSGLEPLSLEQDFEVASVGKDFSFHGGGQASAPIMRRARAYTKLECMNARDINATVMWFNILVAMGVMFSIVSIIFGNTLFYVSITLPNIPGVRNVGRIVSWTPSQRGAVWFEILEAVIMIVLFLYAVVLFSAYVAFLLLGRHKRSNEQIWTALMLLSIVFYMNPYDPIVRILASTSSSFRTYRATGVFFACVRVASFSLQSLLYSWFSIASYRRLEQRVTWRDFGFYAPRLVIVLGYVMYKLCFAFLCDIYFSELPLMSVVGCIRLYVANKTAPLLGILSTVFLTLFELFIILLMFLDFRRTNHVHNDAEYTTFRTKIVGYRFFLHQHFVFYVGYTLVYLLVLLGFPYGVQQLSLWTGQVQNSRGNATAVIRSPAQGSIFDTQYAPVGLYLVILVYATIEAYAKLPVKTPISPWTGKKTSIGAFASSARRATPEPEPVTYRKEENDLSVVGNPNTFTMATHIKLFNLAWYIYYYDTPKQSKLDPDVAANGLRVVDCISNDETDTRVIVLQAHDRICVAFKGTSSKANVATDIKLNTRPLRDVLPTAVSVHEAWSADSAATARIDAAHAETQEVLQSRRFRHARVHAGFVYAYSSVASKLLNLIQSLLTTSKRPVLFSGHSLGGALATLASVDLVLQPWWAAARSEQSAMVSTFGSPRVGNSRFAQLYNELKIIHWRLVAGGDLITRLPKVGYDHVGHKVAISQTGALFIDPDALETRLWHRPKASIVDHKKATYLLALHAWCDKQHGLEEHGFWKFHVSRSDARKYQEAFASSGPSSIASAVTPSALDPAERAKLRAARLKVWADAIDKLEPRKEDKPLDIIELWARLTKCALADIRAYSEEQENDDGPLSYAFHALIEPEPIDEDDVANLFYK